jgi:hypothetical protein
VLGAVVRGDVDGARTARFAGGLERVGFVLEQPHSGSQKLRYRLNSWRSPFRSERRAAVYMDSGRASVSGATLAPKKSGGDPDSAN